MKKNKLTMIAVATIFASSMGYSTEENLDQTIPFRDANYLASPSNVEALTERALECPDTAYVDRMVARDTSSLSERANPQIRNRAIAAYTTTHTTYKETQVALLEAELKAEQERVQNRRTIAAIATQTDLETESMRIRLQSQLASAVGAVQAALDAKTAELLQAREDEALGMNVAGDVIDKLTESCSYLQNELTKAIDKQRAAQNEAHQARVANARIIDPNIMLQGISAINLTGDAEAPSETTEVHSETTEVPVAGNASSSSSRQFDVPSSINEDSDEEGL